MSSTKPYIQQVSYMREYNHQGSKFNLKGPFIISSMLQATRAYLALDMELIHPGAGGITSSHSYFRWKGFGLLCSLLFRLNFNQLLLLQVIL